MEYRKHVFMRVGYFYAMPEDYERYQIAIKACGWQSTYLINQFLSSFIGKNLDYYRTALQKAAAAMDVDPKELYKLCRSAEEPELPLYKTARPDYGSSPLASVVSVQTGAEYRYRIGKFKCSGRNAVALRVAAHVERESTPLTLSRIMAWHFATYWDKAYATQIQNDYNLVL